MNLPHALLLALDGTSQDVLSLLAGLRAWGFAGGMVFILLYAGATVLLIPGSLLTLGAGLVFGLFWGSLYVLLGASLGATLAFLLGRYGLRSWVERQLAKRPQFAALDRAIGQQGWRIVVLTRLSPLIPFGLLNYALGLTPIAFKDYLLGFGGMLPGTVMYVYLGTIAGDLARPTPSPLLWGLRLLGLGATVTVAIILGRIARRRLQDTLDPP